MDTVGIISVLANGFALLVMAYLLFQITIGPESKASDGGIAVAVLFGFLVVPSTVIGLIACFFSTSALSHQLGWGTLIALLLELFYLMRI